MVKNYVRPYNKNSTQTTLLLTLLCLLGIYTLSFSAMCVFKKEIPTSFPHSRHFSCGSLPYYKANAPYQSFRHYYTSSSSFSHGKPKISTISAWTGHMYTRACSTKALSLAIDVMCLVSIFCSCLEYGPLVRCS